MLRRMSADWICAVSGRRSRSGHASSIGSGRLHGQWFALIAGLERCNLVNDEDAVTADHRRDIRPGAPQVVQEHGNNMYDCDDDDYPGAQHVLILRGQRVQRRALCCAGAVSACAPSTFSYKR